MRIWEYIKDKAGILIGYLLFIAVMLIAFRAMRTPGELTVIFLVLTVLLLVTVILTDYINNIVAFFFSVTVTRTLIPILRFLMRQRPHRGSGLAP